VMSLISFFWSASLPLVEATTLSHLGSRTDRYGAIRMWGSVGFIAAVLGLGFVLDVLPIGTLLWAVLGILVGMAIFSRRIPEAPVPLHENDSEPLWQVLRRPEVVALLGACFLMAAAHGPYYTFYSIYLVEHGYSKSLVGWLWAVGVICEIGVFLAMPRIMEGVSLKNLLLLSFAAAVLRFLIIAWAVDWPAAILLAQTLHALTFGTYHAAAIAFVHRFFRGRHQARGQALYNSVAFGAGGTLGGLYSGAAWDALGAGFTFTVASVLAMLAFVLLQVRLRP
jgi:MFS transporter, PPP family, 3-phenylpropionic acid transporter